LQTREYDSRATHFDSAPLPGILRVKYIQGTQRGSLARLVSFRKIRRAFFRRYSVSDAIELEQVCRYSEADSMPPFPIFSQADQNQRSCLDTETGLLVNHAYGLADMKVRTHHDASSASQLVPINVSRECFQWHMCIFVVG